MTARPENAGETAPGAAEPGGTARENVIGYLFDGDGRQVCAVREDMAQPRAGVVSFGVDWSVPGGDHTALTLVLRDGVALTAVMAAAHHGISTAELLARLIAAEGQRIGIRQLADAREGRG